MPSRARRRGSLALLFGLLLALAVPGLTFAHAEVETSSPAADSIVDAQPGSLEATFTEAVDPAKTSIEVRDAAGSVVAASQASDISADGLSMSMPLPTLSDGSYEVRWTTAALDGHIERGTYVFTVALAASPSPAPSPSPSPAASPSSAPSPSPAASVSPSPSPAASPTTVGDDASSSTDVGSLTLPLVAIVIVVAILGAWFVQRRRA